MGGRRLAPVGDLAKTLALVRRNKPKSPLPRIAGLPTEAQIKLEDDYNARCVAYAKKNLDL